MARGVIGIPDPWIWMAYFLCLAATALCVVHAAIRGRKQEAEPSQAEGTGTEPAKEA